MDPSIVKKVVAGVVIFIVFVIVVLYLMDTGDWSEWTLVGEAPTCGSGIKKYVRTCTIGSVAQALGKKCLGDAGKTERYDLSPCPIKGRYVFIERVTKSSDEDSTEENMLNIGEVKILGVDDKTLIDSNTVATAGSVYGPGYEASKLIDFDTSTFAHTSPLASATDFSKQWFKIDLGSEKLIKSIELINRTQGWQHRLNGVRLRIQNGAGVDVFTGPEIRKPGSAIPKVVYDNWLQFT